MDPGVAVRWRALLRDGAIVACDPFLIEVLYSAQSGAELRETQDDILKAMPHIRCDTGTWEIAFGAQQAMADAAGLMHRRKPLDFLIAATAHQHGLGVLHYDHGYDLIAEHGGLDFASVWIAPAGSLD